jgi:hypothetical protein
MIIPSQKVAERSAKSESARAQGEAAIASMKYTADCAVLGVEHAEGIAHEKTESAAERSMEYGSPKGGMKNA